MPLSNATYGKENPPMADDKPADPVPVAEQEAAGIPPEDTVTIAEQKTGTPPPEPSASSTPDLDHEQGPAAQQLHPQIQANP